MLGTLAAVASLSEHFPAEGLPLGQLIQSSPRLEDSALAGYTGGTAGTAPVGRSAAARTGPKRRMWHVRALAAAPASGLRMKPLSVVPRPSTSSSAHRRHSRSFTSVPRVGENLNRLPSLVFTSRRREFSGSSDLPVLDQFRAGRGGSGGGVVEPLPVRCGTM